MVNKVPMSWNYSDEMENLFYFFQASEELLSFSSPDSYRLTVHNAHTLCFEASNIYSFLKGANQIDRFYKQYLQPVIDELLFVLHQDFILKKELGIRFESVITGLTEARETPSLLMRWINLILKSCSLEKYIELCKDVIINFIFKGNEKKRLLYCTNSFYVSLVYKGYNPEFLYQTLIRYFDSKNVSITRKEQIKDFLEKTQPEYTEYELYLVADTYLIDTFAKINPNFKTLISTLNESDVKNNIEKSKTLKTFYDNYCSQHRSNISMISYKTRSYDPYNALEEIESYFNLLQLFSGYFKHKTEQKLYFDAILKSGDKYSPIKLRKIIPNRPFLEEELINHRIKKILEAETISPSTLSSILSALSMHLDAINCKKDETMLRTFWTAIEALFFYSSTSGEHDGTISSLSCIIEKTYLLKVLRTVYAQIKDCCAKEDLDKLGIDSFISFIYYFSEFEPDSADFKKLTSILRLNPLLRSRIYNLRKELFDSNHILEKLKKHNKRIEWQIKRIYRTRNLSTHAGIKMPYIKDILFNLHNYFDYVINFIICKIDNKEYIDDISTIVFEARTDNQLYIEQLKDSNKLSKDNCLELLLGPDKEMIQYEFEVNPTE